MERKIDRKYCTYRLFSATLSIWTLWSCAQPARFGSDIKEESIHYVSAAHNVFVAGRRANEELSFSFQANRATQNIQMLASAPENIIMKQQERPTINDTYIQGHQSQTVDEEFAVSMLDKLDLLLVVDNSSSMSPYQEKLAASLAPLLSNISNTDWRIMVTSTSALRRRNPTDPTIIDKLYGCPRINASDPADNAVISREDMLRNPKLVSDQFAWKVMVGETGDPIERGLLAATSGLTGECGQISRSWIRPDSHKAVLVLTDEENCGSDPDQNCDRDADSNPQYFIDHTPPGTQFFALLHDHSMYAECLDVGYIRKPDDYRWLINKTGGKEGNMCVGNYTSTLTEISRNIHPVTRKEFDLAYQPELGSIKFTVDGKPWSSNFILDGRKVFLGDSLPKGAKVLKITYGHDPVPLIQKFPLSVAADTTTLQVKVNGKPVDQDQYQMENDAVVFNKMPAELAVVELLYRVQQNLPQFFSLPADAILETVSATVSAQPVKDFLIVGTENREIYFPTAPRDGETIVLSFESQDTRILRYPSLAYNRNQVEQVQAFDKDSRQPIALSWDKQQLVFHRDDVQNERAVELIYTLTPDSSELVLDLHQEPRDGSLSIRSSNEDKQCVSDMIKDETKLFFPCPPQKLGELVVNYEYISQIDRSFRVRGDFSTEAKWKVKVDGVETTEYIRNNSTVEFPEARFATDTVIDIEVWEPVRT